MNFIPYGKQSIDQKDVDALVTTLHSDYLTTGPKIAEFEQALCHYIGAKYCVAVSNGTAALHIAALTLLKTGDRVITTPNSFLATSNAILYTGAEPIFIDIAQDGNIDLDLCEEYLKNDPSVKALFVVHFSGNPINQKKLKKIKETYNIRVLEDCAHSIGAEFDGIKAGSCTHSECSILSFHPVKHMTTGEGGAVTTNDPRIYAKLLQLRNHGMIREPSDFTDKGMAYDEKGNLNPWYYEMQTLGFNYRITDFQCALGISQITKLDQSVSRRREIAQIYDKAFRGHSSIIRSLYNYDGNSSYHLYVVLVDFSKLSISKAELFAKMREKKIGLQLHYIPINKQPYYRARGYGSEKTPRMDTYYSNCFSLPMYPTLTDQEQKYVIGSLLEILHG